MARGARELDLAHAAQVRDCARGAELLLDMRMVVPPVAAREVTPKTVVHARVLYRMAEQQAHLTPPAAAPPNRSMRAWPDPAARSRERLARIAPDTGSSERKD
jgi:hypothetical protein